MAENSEDLYARAVAAADEHGRLPAPPISTWDVFPWEVVDGAIAPKRLPPPAEEPPREGEGGKPCGGCGDVEDRVIWTDGTWRVMQLSPMGLPIVVMLETVEHLDFPELDDERAAEFGRLTVRLTRIIENRPGIGRCHVDRWGDGGSHCHVWFWGRPERQAAILGSYAVEWADILPPVPDDVRREDLAAVAAGLAAYGGEARLS